MNSKSNQSRFSLFETSTATTKYNFWIIKESWFKKMFNRSNRHYRQGGMTEINK